MAFTNNTIVTITVTTNGGYVDPDNTVDGNGTGDGDGTVDYTGGVDASLIAATCLGPHGHT